MNIKNFTQNGRVIFFTRLVVEDDDRNEFVRLRAASIKSVKMGLNRAEVRIVTDSFKTTIAVAEVIVGLNPKVIVSKTSRSKQKSEGFKKKHCVIDDFRRK
jgi:hypothetical protein